MTVRFCLALIPNGPVRGILAQANLIGHWIFMSIFGMARNAQPLAATNVM